jgi:hypothetical protein
MQKRSVSARVLSLIYKSPIGGDKQILEGVAVRFQSRNAKASHGVGFPRLMSADGSHSLQDLIARLMA